MYSQHWCLRLLRWGEQKLRKRYEHVVWSRPDLLWVQERPQTRRGERD